MKYKLASLPDATYKKFKNQVDTFRKCSYYIIDFVSISELREQGQTNDQIARIVAEYFDDQEWLPAAYPDYGKYVVDEKKAKELLSELMRGGPEYGHVNFDMEVQDVDKIWNDFMSFFDKKKTLYSCWLGDNNYVWQYGVIALDQDKAGVLNIVKND